MPNSTTCKRRRAVLANGLLLGALPLVGCTALDPRQSENQERKTFVDGAMADLQDQARKESLAQQGNGAASALSLSAVVPFADWDYYYVKGGRIVWRPNPGQTFQLVDVPEGFVTDLTSIPRLLWQIARPEGRFAYAAVVHDYLYWTQTRPRDEADRIFKFAMEDSKVSQAERWAIYQAVDKLGQGAWDRNAQLKKAGERRQLAKFPNDLSISWEAWKNIPGNVK